MLFYMVDGDDRPELVWLVFRGFLYHARLHEVKPRLFLLLAFHFRRRPQPAAVRAEVYRVASHGGHPVVDRLPHTEQQGKLAHGGYVCRLAVSPKVEHLPGHRRGNVLRGEKRVGVRVPVLGGNGGGRALIHAEAVGERQRFHVADIDGIAEPFNFRVTVYMENDAHGLLAGFSELVACQYGTVGTHHAAYGEGRGERRFRFVGAVAGGDQQSAQCHYG